MWFLILGGMFLATLLGFSFIVLKTTKFSLLKQWKHKKMALVLSAILWIFILSALTYWGGPWNMMASFIHLLVFWMIFELIFTVIQKLRRKKFEKYHAGRLALVVTVCYLAVGMFFAHHVFRTTYDIKTEHVTELDAIKIVGFSDSHIGATFHADQFKKYIEKMNQENPDLVVIAGDFVDDDSSYEDMVGACEALSHLKTKYGVYYVYGNHDAGYYGKEHRGYGKEELAQCLKKNKVIVLEDETVNLDKNLYLCGRQDASESNRMSMKEIMQEISEDACVVVLDHQPNDYDAEEECKVDLVISGHTHGGQMIPILKAGEWLGVNDMTYGYAKRNLTNFIVSSGISDWALKFKTGCFSEYFVINLLK
ncbi:MAG: metallophosphoesterase [Eubacteriales bacterium]|nr:metallophosphoesterase [Eubacteriales bacterium]